MNVVPARPVSVAVSWTPAPPTDAELADESDVVTPSAVSGSLEQSLLAAALVLSAPLKVACQ